MIDATACRHGVTNMTAERCNATLAPSSDGPLRSRSLPLAPTCCGRILGTSKPARCAQYHSVCLAFALVVPDRGLHVAWSQVFPASKSRDFFGDHVSRL